MQNRIFVLSLFAVLGSSAAHAEGFENVHDLFASGDWAQYNLSNPVNPANSDPWTQGDASVFGANSGPANSYITANYTATGTADSNYAGNISAWLFAPTRTWSNGDTIQFATRTAEDSLFADRLQVRLSTSGTSVFAGWTDTSVGNFDNLLLDINPNLDANGYPGGWTMYSATVSGLTAPTLGRVGFRYFVTDGGSGGNNSNIVGLDDYNVQAVPEPASIAIFALGGLAILRRRGNK